MTDLATHETVTGINLRRAMSAYASGVAVITTTQSGSAIAITASSLTSVSLSPPLVLVCIREDSTFHRALLRSGIWGVSILAMHAANLAERLSIRGRGDEQLAGIPHGVGPQLGVPLLTEAISKLECRTESVHRAGDHSIFVGYVAGASGADGLTYPLVHHRGSYHTLTELPHRT